jgi:UDPglucose 6-dehydrogenase
VRIGIIGYGVVGKALSRFLSRSCTVSVYDKFIDGYNDASHKANVFHSDLVFIAVPTPTAEDGHCDTTAVEDALSWVGSPICLKSTVIPGTVERLTAATSKQIAFSPEYMGESPTHPWPETDSCGFLIVGGSPLVSRLVVQAYQLCNPGLACYETDARTAELCKYMENCFLATKVAFVNQFHDMAELFGVSFDELRKLWLLDRRIGESHTTVTKERGFGGRCLPKDMFAIVAATRTRGGAPLLECILQYNSRITSREVEQQYTEAGAATCELTQGASKSISERMR